MTGPFVKDISTGEFQSEVIEKSRSVPVVVDFWAEWCGPCRMLAPVLEKLAAEFDGSFVLVKVNTDQDPGLAASFGVRSIPNVKVFRDGKIAGELSGAQRERVVREFLQSLCPDQAGQLVLQAEGSLVSGDLASAADALRRALEIQPRHAAAHLLLARLEMKRGNVESAASHLDEIGLEAREYEAAETLRPALEYHRACRQSGGLEAARANFAKDPSPLDACYALACCLASCESYEEALAHFLEIVERDKEYRDQAARRAMVAIFALLGDHHPLTESYRRRLASALF